MTATRIVREYPCGAKATIAPLPDGRLEVEAWRDATTAGRGSFRLPAVPYKTMEKAIAACDAIVAEHSPLRRDITHAPVAAPGGWKACGGVEAGKESFTRDYICAAHGQIERTADGGFEARCWRNRGPDNGKVNETLLPTTEFDCLADAVAACDKATADYPPIHKLDLDEAYNRLDHGGEHRLTADVLIERGAIIEAAIENWFGDYDGSEIRFTFKRNGDIVAHLRASEDDQRYPPASQT